MPAPTRRVSAKFLTKKDLIDLFCVVGKTIDRWVTLGKLPKPKKMGRKNLWSEEAILKIVKRLSSDPQAKL